MNKKLKSLLIDDNDGIEINYHKGTIDNEYLPKITDIDELYDIFNINTESIFNNDISALLTFILTDDSEISLHQYIKNKKDFSCCESFDIDDVAFIKLNIPNKDYILISAKNNCNISCIGVPMFKKIENHFLERYNQFDKVGTPLMVDNKKYRSDYNGYKNSQNILKQYNAEYIPAVSYCNRIRYKYCRYTYQGYLPALGEIIYIRSMLEIIMYLIGQSCDFEDNLPWQSSTLFNNHYNWVVYSINEINRYYLKEDEQFGLKNVESDGLVFPVFKKIVNNW